MFNRPSRYGVGVDGISQDTRQEGQPPIVGLVDVFGQRHKGQQLGGRKIGGFDEQFV
jgi:hypothetical protein